AHVADFTAHQRNMELFIPMLYATVFVMLCVLVISLSSSEHASGTIDSTSTSTT
ncbi:unnamed protein product, partial [Amoebophrya sp. A25]